MGTPDPLQTQDMGPPGLPPDMGHGSPLALLPLPSDIWWPSLKTCSNLFIGLHCTGPPPTILTAGGHRTVGKQAVCILLESLLVFFTLDLIVLKSMIGRKELI